MKLTSQTIPRLLLVSAGTLIVLGLSGSITHSVTAARQAGTKAQRIRAGDAFPIPETGALVVLEGTDLKVRFVPPQESLREPYKNVDLRTDDVILLANGKRVKTIADLSRIHADTPIGQEFKLGIQRGKEMMIVSFTKADPKDLPKRTMQIVTAGGDGEDILPAVGVMLTEKKNAVVVGKLLPVETAAIKNLDVREGDIIRSINGTPVSSVKRFVELYDNLEIGAKVLWKTERKGEPITIEFAKPKPGGPMIIRRTVK